MTDPVARRSGAADPVARRSGAADPVGYRTGPPGPVDALPLRLVLFGPSGAGKTTTARALGTKLGQDVVTPWEQDDGRTLLFDWLEYVGGRHDGRAIRTQVVTVPGHLPARSRVILATADAVLFVADTTAEGIDGTVASAVALHGALQRHPNPPGVVVQANKRDLPSALPVDEVRRRLRLDEQAVVIETAAVDGDGVRQAFVFTVREALKRHARSPGTSAAAVQRDASDLAAWLRATEARMAAAPDPAPR